MINPPPDVVVDDLIRRALEEDLGRAGDLTSAALIGPEARASGRIVARRSGRLAGLPFALRVFRFLGGVETRPLRRDGEDTGAGEALAELEGSARAILAGERTALNLLGHLSGIATAAAEAVARVAGAQARIVDTRKTTPGLRALEKYAVRCGGASNHRFGLDDGILIKDNHLRACPSIAVAVAAARAAAGHMVRVEVEVENLDQLGEALQAGADAVLLDNMTPSELRVAVAEVAGRCLTEASGGIGLEDLTAVAETGVDLISLGWITHSAPRLDVALDLD